MSGSMGRKRQSNFGLPPRMHLKSGTYYYVTNTQPRKWISLGKDLAQAKLRWASLEDDGNDKTGDSVSVLIDEWLELPHEDMAASTLRVYKSVAKQLKAVFGDSPIQKITTVEVAAWLDNHHSKTQANMGKAVLSNVMDIAVRRGKMPINPCRQVKRNKIKGRKRYLTDDEFQRIREHAAQPLKAAMDISYVTGARISDVLAIRLSAWTDDGLTIKQIKTGALQLFQRTAELERVIAEAKKIPRPFRSVYLLCTRTGGKYSTSTLRNWWVEAVEKSGVKDAHFHDIRGKSATDAKLAGEDYQALLGHTTKAMSDAYIKIEQPQIVAPRKRTL